MSAEKPLVDSFNRMVTYMRVSVTDRCNLDCNYCRPTGAGAIPEAEILTDDEISRLVAVGASLGVRKVRITGGEPLVRAGIAGLAARIAATNGVEETTLTTNGMLLSEYAERLKRAGLRRINVSLDSLKPERYGRICSRGSLERVIEGIREAKQAGLAPVKVNVVVMRGENEDELADFAQFGRVEGVTVRFIEFMPAGEGENWRGKYVSRDEMLLRLADALDPDRMAGAPRSQEPARYYPLRDGAGEIGIISPVSHDFCSSCNRLRLTPDGFLLGCLMAGERHDLKTPLRSGANDEDLSEYFRKCLLRKGLKGDVLHGRPRMRQIGG